MGTCFLYGNGGGSELNFKVVGGTTQPGNPKENTIWVNTDTAITAWVFSASEPESPIAGMVWIATANTGSVNANLLKKNAVTVCLLSAKQYIGGSWSNKAAYIYQDASWVQFSSELVYLYDTGSECTGITGGWSAYAYKRSGASSVEIATAPSVSRGSSSMTVTHNSSWECYRGGVVLTNNSVDVTNWETLSISVTARTLSAANQALSLILTKTKGNGFTVLASCSLNSTGVKTVNISSISGSCYVGIYGSGTESSVSVTFNKVYLS